VPRPMAQQQRRVLTETLEYPVRGGGRVAKQRLNILILMSDIMSHDTPSLRAPSVVSMRSAVSP
jgi:hypothetical protein